VKLVPCKAEEAAGAENTSLHPAPTSKVGSVEVELWESLTWFVSRNWMRLPLSSDKSFFSRHRSGVHSSRDERLGQARPAQTVGRDRSEEAEISDAPHPGHAEIGVELAGVKQVLRMRLRADPPAHDQTPR